MAALEKGTRNHVFIQDATQVGDPFRVVRTVDCPRVRPRYGQLATDTSIDGTGTGVLGGTTTVTYSTAVGFNAGVSYPENWASYLGTAAATGGSVTYQSGGVLGGASPSVGGTTETITFSSTVTNPILLVAFLGGQGTYAADTFNFGPNSYTLLSLLRRDVFRAGRFWHHRRHGYCGRWVRDSVPRHLRTRKSTRLQLLE